MPQGVFLPSRIGEGLHAGCPEVGAKADCGQVSKIGKEPGWVARVRGGVYMMLACGLVLTVRGPGVNGLNPKKI